MVNYQEVEAEFTAVKPEDLTLLAAKIAAVAEDYKIWLFVGDLGAGKTTLIQALCEYFGIVDQVTSPTYSLVQEYRDLNDNAYFHFDFYRLNNIQEAIDIGCEEYFYSGQFCFVEWPDLILSILPERRLVITIETNEDNSRSINITKHDKSR